jgi:DNA-binding transcriptional LysR family regulator
MSRNFGQHYAITAGRRRYRGDQEGCATWPRHPFTPEDVPQSHVDAGELVRVLADWTPPFPGYHLYYPSRRQQSPAFARLVEALRYSG